MKPYDSSVKSPKKGEAYFYPMTTDGKSRRGRCGTVKRIVGRCKKVARQDGKKTINSSINEL